MVLRSSETSKWILNRLGLAGLAACVALAAAVGLFTANASAAGNTEVFMRVECTPKAVAIGQASSCEVLVNHVVGNPDENLPSGPVLFSDNGKGGSFSPGASCTLVRVSPFTSGCKVSFSSTTAGGRTIKADYAGDAIHKAGVASADVKVFIPNSVRFAAPGGTGKDPCTVKAEPCSLFTAASTQAPNTSIFSGAEVELAPGTYTSGELGPAEALQLERGIVLRGESGAPRPLISFNGGTLFGGNATLNHLEIESKVGLGAFRLSSGVVDEVIARSAGAGSMTCFMESGVIRDTACLSTGAGASAVGSAVFVERGEAFEPKLRNVNAISTGAGSFGVKYSLESDGAVASTINASAVAVIAKGTKADVEADAPTFEGVPGGIVRVNFDHSDYATIEPSVPSGTIFITPAGDPSHSNITAVPLLAGDRIHQLFGSPTIDAGATDGSSGTIDIDGETRKQGPAVDIGADERIPANNTETKLICKTAGPMFANEATKCTATVTDKADNGTAKPLAGGTVNFTDVTQPSAISPTSCTLVAVDATHATCQTEVDFKPTAIANHSLEASYPGDGGIHLPSAEARSILVKQQPNDTETKFTCRATSLITGETTKCTVAVSDKANHGAASAMAGQIVSFKDKTEAATFSPTTCTLATVSPTLASCQAEVDYKPTTIATHSLEASYPGDGDFHAPSSEAISMQVKIQPNDTETVLNCKATSVPSGEAVNCTATVTDKANHNAASPLAGGTVNFKDPIQEGGSSPSPFTPTSCTLTTVNSTQATCQLEVVFRGTVVGNHTLEASYPGDGGTHAPSVGTLTVQVKKLQNRTETRLDCKATTLITGESTKCTATVSDTADKNPASSLAGLSVNFRDRTQSDAFPPTAECVLATISSTQATCQVEVEIKPTLVGNHSLEANFGGGASHLASTGLLTLQVKARTLPNHTETKLSCTAAAMTSGETTNCTAKVTDNADNGPVVSMAGGLVTFKDNTEASSFVQPAACALIALNATQATCQVEVEFKPTSVAVHQLEATYPGDTAHVGSSGALPVTVRAQPNDTETKLECKATTIVSGDTTKCTAAVSDKANHSAASSMVGDVITFNDATQAGAFSPATCVLATVSSTQAACAVEVDFKPTAVGNHSVEAVFPGDSNHVRSVATPTLLVKPKPNTTETKLTCQAPSLITGDGTHCTATVIDRADNTAATPPSGQVNFKDNTQAGSFSPASCQLQTTGAGVATCQAEVELKPTTIATHSLEASYQGDGGVHAGSTGTLDLQVKIRPNHTETELTCNPGSLITGGATNCTATVTDNADNNPASSMTGGTVSFADSTEPGIFSPATCTLATLNSTQARCQLEVELTPTLIATHSLRASYQGDGGAHATSVGTLALQVKPQPNDTETKLECKANTVISGDSTKCKVTVSDNANHNPASPMAGTVVTFLDAGEGEVAPPVGCMLITLSPTQAGCQAEVEFKLTTVARHGLEARYPGDAGKHAPSAGIFFVDVKPVPHATTTSLVCNPATLVLGAGASQCTATVEDISASGASHPTGEVKLDVVSGDGALAAKSCNLPDAGGAKASCQVIAYTPGKAGAHELKASYGGDETHKPSAGLAKLTVNAPTGSPPPTAAAPNTTLAKKPAKSTASPVALFRFSSDQPGVTFRCKLDKKAAKKCTSPLKVKVKPGKHTLTIIAINAQGVADPSPVVYRWKVGPAKRRPKH